MKPRHQYGRILEIKDLAITFKTGSGEVKAVKNAHLSIMPGETVAIVGESGSGKSTTALAAIGLLPNNGRVSCRADSASTAKTSPMLRRSA